MFAATDGSPKATRNSTILASALIGLGGCKGVPSVENGTLMKCQFSAPQNMREVRKWRGIAGLRRIAFNETWVTFDEIRVRCSAHEHTQPEIWIIRRYPLAQ